MATLEERLQNLTQDINPMGAMSDMDRKIAMNAMPRQQSAAIMDMVGKTNGAISNREMEMFRNAMPTNSLAPSVSTLDQKRLEQAFKEIQSLAGVLTNKEQDMLSQANDPITLLTTLRDIKQNLRSSGRLMSDTDKEIAMNAMPSNPMQPLVEMGFGEQVDIILGNPADSDISRQAQQQIINEMGTGMDIDSFLMEVNNLAPKGAMSNVDAEVMQRLMSAGRDGDTAIGHLTEGEVVIPAPVLEANPQAADMLEQTMSQMGIDPRTRVVDSTGEIGGIASINPETGFQEFGFLSDVWKKAKKVVKAVAPIAVNFIPGVGPLAKAALTAGIGKASGLSTKEALLGGALSYGGSKLFGGTPAAGSAGKASTGNIFSRAGEYIMPGKDGIGLLGNLGKSASGAYEYVMPGKDNVGLFGNVKSGIGSLFGGGQQLPEIEALPDGSYSVDGKIMGYSEMIDAGLMDRSGNLVRSPLANLSNNDGNFLSSLMGPSQGSVLDYDPATGSGQSRLGLIEDFIKGGSKKATESIFGGGDDTSSGGMGMMGKLGIAGLAGLIGKLAYEEAKNQKGVPLTPLTQMDQLGRYNIAAEMARQAGEGSPSRVEYGLNPEGMPALSGGSPRMAAYGGIMNLNMGGMPRYNYGGGVQYFNQGGTVAMAEGGDMDATINIEEFPAKDGQIDGPGTEVSDDIPAMLSDGEFVMTAKAVKGAGSFNINDNNGILTLTPNGDPSRDSGTRVMYKLMEHFGRMA
jgi:hypothetical protein